MLQSNASLADDFRDCIEYLNARRVVFVLVGGYAVGWHGVVRATGDIDFLYEQKVENVARLCAGLRDFGAPERLIDFKDVGLDQPRVPVVLSVADTIKLEYDFRFTRTAVKP